MKILAVDTSAVTASVCIAEDHRLCGEFFVNTRQKHSRTLMPMLENLLHSLEIGLAEIDLFAVSAGPGSFTGVRIGVSCIKGLAMPFDTPCVGVSSLEAMVHNLTCVDGTVCAVMDARCGQVYNAIFSVEGGKQRRITPDRALPIDALAEECQKYGKRLYLVGDGADLCYNVEQFQALGATLVPEAVRYQRASGVASAAFEAFQRGEQVTVGQLAPIYLRPPQAQREQKKRLEESI